MKYISLLIFALLILPLYSNAQLISNQPEINIITDPRSPEPNSNITVSVDAYTLDTNGATFIWYVDGIELTDARNSRSFNLKTKGIGEQTKVSISVGLRSGLNLNKSIIINPSRVDMIIEANTSVPGFYKGRQLPSVGSIARVVAIPHAGNISSSYTYLWKLDNQVLYGGPTRGKNVAEFEVGMGRDQILSVDVIDQLGETVARKSIVIPVSEPEIHFYAENPLRGLTTTALPSPYILTGEEVTVKAEPYYMSNNILSSNTFIEWKLNNQKIDNPNFDPQYITIRRNNNSGQAEIGFHIRNLNQLIQGSENTFRIQF